MSPAAERSPPETGSPPAGGAAPAPRRPPDVLLVLVVWGAARAVTWLVTAAVSSRQPASGWAGADPGYLAMAGIWDGDWYRRIAEHGYPLPLPRDASGAPVQSEWAFFPAYPLLVRLVGTVTGLGWTVAAPTTSLLLGAAAAVVTFRLFRRRAGRGPALAGVALLATFPSAPVTQYAYTESLALLALAAALLALLSRRYATCALAVVVLGLTRPVGLPFAVVVLAHAVRRWRRGDLAPVAAGGLAGLAGLAVAAALAWPVATGLLTGQPDAYARVQAAWRGGGQLDWVLGWWHTARAVLGEGTGTVLLLLAVAGLVVAVAGPWARVLGTEMRAWCLAYGGFLLAVVQPSTPVLRFWLLMLPLALLTACLLRRRSLLAGWLAAQVALQALWVARVWHFTPPADWPP